MNLRSELHKIRIVGIRIRRAWMTAIEDPAPFNPHAIANRGPNEFGHRAKVARETFLVIATRIHQRGVVPLYFHLCVTTSVPGGVVRADLRGNSLAAPIAGKNSATGTPNALVKIRVVRIINKNKIRRASILVRRKSL